MEEVLPGVFVIPWYAVDKGSTYNGHFLKDGAVLVDPPKMDNYDLMEVARKGPPKHIILTNSDHVRETEYYKTYFGAKVWMSGLETPRAKATPDRTFRDGDRLPGNIRAVAVPHNKLPGETALLIESKKALILGDALLGAEQGKLRLLPAERYADPAKAKEGIRTLLAHDFEHVLVAHGFWILNEGKQAVEAFLNK